MRRQGTNHSFNLWIVPFLCSEALSLKVSWVFLALSIVLVLTMRYQFDQIKRTSQPLVFGPRWTTVQSSSFIGRSCTYTPSLEESQLSTRAWTSMNSRNPKPSLMDCMFPGQAERNDGKNDHEHAWTAAPRPLPHLQEMERQA